MGTVLHVLIWIGIILLVILGITLLLIAIILLSPIRYQAEARGDARDGSLVADIRITWLGLAFGFYGHYDRLSGQPPSRSVRILGLDPSEWLRKRAERKRDRARAARRRRLAHLRETNPEEYNRLREEARRRRYGGNAGPAGPGMAPEGGDFSADGDFSAGGADLGGADLGGADFDEADFDGADFDEADFGGEEADGFSHGIPFVSWFLELVLKIISKIRSACVTIGNVNEYRRDPAAREAVHILLYRLFRILKHSFPQISGRLAFGFTDPSLTGELLALASMLYPLWAGSLVLQPDFSEFLLNGELHISGRIRPGTVGWHGLMTILHKEVRDTIRSFRSR